MAVVIVREGLGEREGGGGGGGGREMLVECLQYGLNRITKGVSQNSDLHGLTTTNNPLN